MGKFEKSQHLNPVKKLNNSNINSSLVLERILRRKKKTVMFVENLVTMLMNAGYIRLEMEKLIIITIIITRTATLITVRDISKSGRK